MLYLITAYTIAKQMWKPKSFNQSVQQAFCFEHPTLKKFFKKPTTLKTIIAKAKECGVWDLDKLEWAELMTKFI